MPSRLFIIGSDFFMLHFRWSIEKFGSGYYMKLFTFVLCLFLMGTMYNFWYGKNGWKDYKEYQKRIEDQETVNQSLVDRNNLITSEIKDLQEGYEGIEDIARSDFGYIKQDETFIRIISKDEKRKELK